MSTVNRVSPLVVVEVILCFGPIGVWWLWGGLALGGGLLYSGTAPTDVVVPFALGGLGLFGIFRLAVSASRGVRGVRAWSVLLSCVGCGLAALAAAGPLSILQRPFDPADIVFLILPVLATVHLLLIAVLRSRASRPSTRSG